MSQPPLALLVALLLPLVAPGARVYNADEGAGNQSQARAPASVKKRALLVAFTYSGRSKLSGTCYDMQHMANFTKRQGYSEVGFLTDDCPHRYAPDAIALVKPKTKVSHSDMKSAFQWLLDGASEGDGLLFYYSGHGEPVTVKKGQKRAEDECNARDEALSLPDGSRYIDDDVFSDLVEQVPTGAHLLAIVDACHSGTILDLPWNFMVPKYYYSCPDDPSKRVFTASQFEWDWAKSPEALGRTYPLPGTVAFISGSQQNQASGDALMTTFSDRHGRTQTIGGLMTFRLTLDHWDWADKRGINSEEVPNPPILDTALENGWSYAQVMEEIVAQVADGDLKTMGGTKQIPNFGASDRLDMSAPFSLGGSAFPAEPAASKTKCPTHAWMKKKKTLKVC